MSTEEPVSTEDEIVHRLRRLEAAEGRTFIGDDAAILPAGGPWVTTMDSQIEGVHFLPGFDVEFLARRLLAVNLSDLAAMGADPAYAFLALSAPKSFDRRRFFDAFLGACKASGTVLAGGDLSSQDRVVAVLTLIGCGAAGRRFLRRDGAKPGHGLWIGGAVGESALGFELLRGGARCAADGTVTHLPDLSPPARRSAERAVRRHVSPSPQLELGRWLSRQEEGGALDISDGLAKDLHRMCAASGVAATLRAEALAPPTGWTEIRDYVERSWDELAFGGGEDYVLCFSLPDEPTPPNSFGARRIGYIHAGSGVFLDPVDGPVRELPASGWDHLADF